jgi:enolase-phosphatase E1
MAISHLLLDIEGTTCPVSFVSQVLFPYARQQMGAYLERHASEPDVAALVHAVAESWRADQHPEAQKLLAACRPGARDAEHVLPYLRWLIENDVKLTPLKDLQGRIWGSGYASGELVAPLFADVPAALQRWHQQGLVLAVYSSGSVPAQQLLYGHSEAGDLSTLFSFWFDTSIGGKLQASSYSSIAAALNCAPNAVLFISDALGELEAAAAAGMACLFSDREGNPGRDCGRFAKISDYSQLTLPDDAHGS